MLQLLRNLALMACNMAVQRIHYLLPELSIHDDHFHVALLKRFMHVIFFGNRDKF